MGAATRTAGWIATAVALAIGGACSTSTASVAFHGHRAEPSNGLSVVTPLRWTVGIQAANPAGVLVFRGNRFIDEAECSSSRTHVGVSITEAPDIILGTFGPRPARFTSRSGGGVSSGHADQQCRSSSQQIDFTHHGRRLRAYLDFGSNASKEDTAAAYGILNSLRVRRAQ